jgi:DNA polymerase alpha subunit A
VPLQGNPQANLAANQYTIVRQWNNIPIPAGFQPEYTSTHKTSRLEMVANERHLLNKFIALLHKLDPDVLVGHNFIGFSLDVLLHRLKANKVELQWSKLGRLRRRQYVHIN